MPYVLTNTITTLPFGYWLKLEIIKEPGTGSDSITNGGFIKAISAARQSVDLIPGAVKPGQQTFEFFNGGRLAEQMIFTSTIDRIEIRLWVSYDAGTTWESIFAGFVKLSSIRYKEVSTLVPETRVYSCSADDYLLSLKDVAVDFGGYSVPNLIALPANAPVYSTDETGAPFQIDTSGTISRPRSGPTRVLERPDAYFFTRKFALVHELLSYITGKVPFISGATAPVTAIDYSDLEHSFYNANTGLSYSFEKLALWYWATDNWTYPFSFFGPQGGPGGAYDAANLQELLSRLAHSLTVVPIPRLYDNAGTLTYRVYFVHRISGTTPAVSGTLAPLMARAFEPAPWMDGVSVETIGLPVRSAQASVLGGKPFNQRNYWYTSPNFDPGADPYVWWQAFIDPRTNESFVQNANAGTGQLFVQTGATSVRNVHKCKILASQSLFETAGVGWYGMQDALFDLVAGNSASNLFAGLKTGFTADFATLRGTDVWDLRMLKRLTIDGHDCVIESVERDVTRNLSRLRLVKLSA